MINIIKSFVQKNSWLFSSFRFIPYEFRLGSSYKSHSRLIDDYNEMRESDKKKFHYERLKALVDYAYENNEFYRFFYDQKGYHPSNFKELSDFSNVPIVTKADLKTFNLIKRSNSANSPFKVNTGGTSGEPLHFYLDKNAFAREWAYMHNIWSYLGYSYLDAKLTFRGKNNSGKPIKYNVVHNEYIVDAYVSLDEIVLALKGLMKKKSIKYIHGYPSSIYEFCRYLKNNGISPSSLFAENLRGVFFGSEYPAAKYRNLIEDVLGVPTISWYGHSEMSVLAFEKEEPFRYFPFQTYGFTEAIPSSSGDSKLIGTSYYNYNSPFIRYDTGDRIEDAQFDAEILSSFKISRGRIGDIIFDKEGNSISLTALIFGRHHEAFNVIDFLQIRQSKKGHATLCVTTKQLVGIEMFNLENVDIIFELEIIPTPIKTSAGKVPLLIS